MQTETMTNRALLDAFSVIEELSRNTMPVAAGYRIAQNQKALLEGVLLYYEYRDKVIEENGAQRSDNGSWIPKADGIDIEFESEEAERKAAKEIAELQEEEIEVGYVPIDIALLSELSIKPSALGAIMWMLEDSSD